MKTSILALDPRVNEQQRAVRELGRRKRDLKQDIETTQALLAEQRKQLLAVIETERQELAVLRAIQGATR